ncbi:hypothetical protein QTH91_13730 [Variovorax dokdonensis]|uniref:Uncharacterized protein n=1 Tax=Variovorax dokdonensis TaxID=344883 RepID=A0ABT7NC93_9BURK|nr:hypothetical protein [Variovorax dokdonensis]MDM0045548.1 hypothetical protein [Variovorax dokdonensis]
MIISPPFLPEQGNAAHADDEAYVESAMLDSMDKVIATGGAPAGSYPLGAALTWHNGLHLRAPSDATQQGRLPVRAIADGTVIFKRAPKPANTDATDPQNYNPSGSEASWTDNGIVIVRHTTDIGATDSTPTSVTYLSVYMHLSSIESTVLESKPIWRKDKIGKAGQIFGQDNQIHFEICMDAANLQKLVGASRPISWTDPSVPPTAHGRTDAVFGSVYIYLPKDTPTSATAPTSHLQPQKGAASIASGKLAEAQWVEIRYSKGQGIVRSYRATDVKDGAKAGTLIGKSLAEPDFEYNLYTEANKRHNSLDTANQISSSPSGWYELLRFGRNLGPDNLPRNAAHWRQIPTAGGTVWADLNADNTFKFSDADFPAFKGWQFFDDDTSQEDQRCDSVELKRVIRDPKAAPESIRARVALTKRLSNTDVREKLKRAICKFPTEWDRSTIAQRYGWLKVDEEFKVEQGKPWDDFSAHCEAISFERLPQEYKDAIWHIHPRTFISHMRNCPWLSAFELKTIYPNVKKDSSIEFLAPLNSGMRKYGINTPLRKTLFLGQGAVEASELNRMAEGGNTRGSYTRETTTWYDNPDEHYFDGYAHRNGNIDTRDHIKFRGRGLKQLTGRYNYAYYWVFRGWLSLSDFDDRWWSPPVGSRRAPVIVNPQFISVDLHSTIDAGGWYWEATPIRGTGKNGLGRSRSTINVIDGTPYSHALVEMVTRLINGGTIGLPSRLAACDRAFKLLGDTT